MKVLLDTRALLWALQDAPELSANARATIISMENEVLVSSASAWEIAIKTALGKLQVPTALGPALDDAGFVRRPIRFEDCEKFLALPSHHRDPFDRMLVAQALQDGIPIVTRDPLIARYPIQTIW